MYTIAQQGLHHLKRQNKPLFIDLLFKPRHILVQNGQPVFQCTVFRTNLIKLASTGGNKERGFRYN